MRRYFFSMTYVVLALLTPALAIPATIDVRIKGVDDGLKTTKQQDHKEAVMNAKLQAVERAGVEIQSVTQVVNFQTKFDMVESKAEAVLLPGFQVVDIGYLEDGTYQVVLIGKVKRMEEGIESKELRYAQSLVKRGQKSKAKKIIDDIITNSKDDNAVAEAMYYQVLWKFASDGQDTFEKLKAYYPYSKYVNRLEALLGEREAERKRLEAERKSRERRLAAEREAERKRREAEREQREKRLEAERKERARRLAAEREAERKRRIERIGPTVDTGINGRFIRGDKGIVLDTRTNLEWVVGPARDMDWYEARDWVSNLSVSGGGWRMPTAEEVKTLCLVKEGIAYQYVGEWGTTELLQLKKVAPRATGFDVWSGEKVNYDADRRPHARTVKIHNRGVRRYWDERWYLGTDRGNYGRFHRAFAVRSHK